MRSGEAVEHYNARGDERHKEYLDLKGYIRNKRPKTSINL